MHHQKFLPVFLGLMATMALPGCKDEQAKASLPPAHSSGHLYLDVHNRVEGLTAEAVAGAHQKDLAIQGKYRVNYLKYWYDEGTGKVFCLVEAPSKEAAATVHKEAHGLVADEITEVKEGY
jgi:hypothetical protein